MQCKYLYLNSIMSITVSERKVTVMKLKERINFSFLQSTDW